MEKLKRIQPPLFPVGDISIPDVAEIRLDNNVPVFMLESGTEELVRIEFIFNAGYIKEYLPLLASTTNMMLREGTVHYSASELNRMIDYYGVFVHFSADRDRASAIFFCLNRHLERIIELASEILFSPVFPKEELNAMLKKRLQWFLINRAKMQNVAIDQFFESIFGKKHPYGHQVEEEDFGKISTPLLADFHAANYTPGNMSIVIAGKIPADSAAFLNRYFGGISGKHIYIEENAPVLSGRRQRKVHVDKPGMVQTAIRIGMATINKRHPDYTGLKVVDAILGGYFGSRLMRNIREEKGYTYGIRSGVTSLDKSGYLVISTETGNEHLADTIREIYKEIRLLQDEFVEKDELETVRNYMLGEMLRMFDGPFALAETFRGALDFGLDFSYYKRFSEKIRTIDPDEIKHLANTYYPVNRLYQVTAGSK